MIQLANIASADMQNGRQLRRVGRKRNPNTRRLPYGNNNFISQTNKYSNYNNFKYNQGKFISYTEPGRFAPDGLRVRLIFQDPTGSRTTTGTANACNWRYRSSAYDPDPLVLTGAIPGFAELANLYYEYCVHGIHANIEVANQDTQSYVLVVWPGNSDLGNNSLTLADIAEYSGNIMANSKILAGASGMNRAIVNSSAMGQQLVGRRFRTDLSYSAPTSTNPTNMYYLNVGAYSPLGNMAYPMVTKIRLIYDIEFFKLRQLES